MSAADAQQSIWSMLPDPARTVAAPARPALEPAEQLRRDVAVHQAIAGDPVSVFSDDDATRFAGAVNVIRRLYEAPDERPFALAVSMGKDSALVSELAWVALAHVPPAERTRPVTVVSTDTQVENPLMAKWQTENLRAMAQAATTQGLPISVQHLRPEPDQGFLVQMIGRGYAPPRRDFRWCTDRLKIQPNTAAMRAAAQGSDDSLLFLGTRKDESVARRASMLTAEAAGRTRSYISPNLTLGGKAEVCTPIEDWTTQDVWNGLMGYRGGVTPWGTHAMWLFRLYDFASASGECGLVVDRDSSCGTAGRFGCHTCTLVETDTTMTRLVQSIAPELRELNEIRNEIRDFERERIAARLDPAGVPITHVDLKTGSYPRHRLEPVEPRRDIRRKRHLVNGETAWHIDIEDSRTARTDADTPAGFHIPGSLTKPWCEYLLHRYLEAGHNLQRTADAALSMATPTTDRGWYEFLRTYEVLPLDQVRAIREIWVNHRYWYDDQVPSIYARATGTPYPG